MKKNKIYAIICATVLLGSSCKKALDINTDPNNPSLEQGTPKLVMPAAVASAAGRIGGQLAILGGIWSQFYTQNTTSNQYKNIDAFNLTKSDFNGDWNELFSGAINDANYVVEKAKAQKDWNYYLMGVTIKAYTYQVLVDLYDQVPYTEALKGAANLQPKFDNGYDIYKDLIAQIDGALSKNFAASTNSVPGTTDLIFPASDASWNVDNWIAFANTLKLKMYLRMAYAKPTEADAGIKAMYTAGATFLSTNAAMTGFVDQENKSNPLYEYNFRKLNTDANLKASRTFLTWLQTNNDPRIASYYYTQTGSSTIYSGINQGDFLNPNPSFNTASKARVLPTDPVDFISAAESEFLQAEALERYYSGVGAKAKYDAGVTKAFSRLGYSASSMIGAGGAYEYPSAGNFEQKLEAIITQKRASMPGSHSLEAFFERNRTGYPVISAVYSTAGSYVSGQLVYPLNGVTIGNAFARRLIFPDSERSKNANTPAEKAITEKVWWDTK